MLSDAGIFLFRKYELAPGGCAGPQKSCMDLHGVIQTSGLHEDSMEIFSLLSDNL